MEQPAPSWSDMCLSCRPCSRALTCGATRIRSPNRRRAGKLSVMSTPFGVTAGSEAKNVEPGRSTLWASVTIEPRGKALEAAEVEGLVFQAKPVPGLLRLDRVAAESLAELRDVALQQVHSRVRRSLAPDLIDQGGGRHDLAGVQEQHREDCARPGATEVERPSILEGFNRSEDLELDAHRCDANRVSAAGSGELRRRHSPVSRIDATRSSSGSTREHDLERTAG